MNKTSPDSEPSNATSPATNFFRVMREGPGQQQVISEPASLDELRNDLRALLEGLEPGRIERQANAIIITGTGNSEDIQVTVQFYVAQPTNTWAAAEGGPIREWTAWPDVVIDEARRHGW